MAPDLETACFRVIQEAVTNVIRHARARHVSVKLNRQGPELRLVIRDDGSGFEPAAVRQRASHGKSLGLMGMQERVQALKAPDWSARDRRELARAFDVAGTILFVVLDLPLSAIGDTLTLPFALAPPPRPGWLEEKRSAHEASGTDAPGK